MFLLGLLAELDETVLIVELDSVLMLLDDFLLDELATSLLLDSTDDFTLEFLMLELEVSFDEALLDDEPLILELFID